MCSNVCIIIGNIKEAVFPEIISPAVLTDKCSITLEISVKIILRIRIIPSDDHHIMVWFLCTNIAVCICAFVIIWGGRL